MSQQKDAMDLSLKINDEPGVVQAINNIAIIYRRQKKLNEAIECHRKNILNRKRLNDLRGAGQTYYNLGRLYPEMAIDSYQKAIENYKKVKSPPIQDILAACERLGKLFLLSNDIEKAIRYLDRSKNIREKLLKSGEEDVHRLANIKGELGHAYLLNGDTTKALKQYDEMLVLYQQMSKEDFDKFKTSPTERYDNAIRHLETALGIASITKDSQRDKEFHEIVHKINFIKNQE